MAQISLFSVKYSHSDLLVPEMPPTVPLSQTCFSVKINFCKRLSPSLRIQTSCWCLGWDPLFLYLKPVLVCRLIWWPPPKMIHCLLVFNFTHHCIEPHLIQQYIHKAVILCIVLYLIHHLYWAAFDTAIHRTVFGPLLTQAIFDTVMLQTIFNMSLYWAAIDTAVIDTLLCIKLYS